MLQIDTTEIAKCNSTDTVYIINSFVARLKNIRDQREYVNAIADFNKLTGCDIISAKTEDVEKYLSMLYARADNGSCTRSQCIKKHKIIAAFCNYAQKLKDSGSLLIPPEYENQMLYYSPRIEADETFRFSRIPSLADIDRLISIGKESDNEFLIVFMLCFNSYLKISDIATLHTKDIFVDGNGRYGITLTRDRRTVPISSELAGRIEAFMEENDNAEYLFDVVQIDESGQYSLDNAKAVLAWERKLQRRLKSYCSRLGIFGYTFNDIRNAAAVYNYSSGIDEYTIADAMGYKSTRHIQKLTSIKLTLPETGTYTNFSYSLT